jgi:uncharacterized protein
MKYRFGVLCVPAFAEEGNKSRRMVAEQARALASMGGIVLVLDLTGTGDSMSHSIDATWEHWRRDLEVGWSWLKGKISNPVWLWGIRLGALLAATQHGALKPEGFLMWQPVTSGKSYVRQLLRLATARLLVGNAIAANKDAHAALMEGHPVEVAGYELNAQLLLPLESETLEKYRPNCKVVWMECSSGSEATLGIAATRVLDNWVQAGCTVLSEMVTGPTFWASQEIEFCAHLISRTCTLIENELVMLPKEHAKADAAP